MLYRIIYNSKDVKEFVRYDYSLEIGFKVLDVHYSDSKGELKFKISDKDKIDAYFSNLIDNYIDFIEKHPDVSEIVIHNSILSLLLRSIKYSINHISDKASFIENLKKKFLFYYKLTALLAMNIVEENLIISSLYAIFLVQDIERKKREKVLEEIKGIMNNEISNANNKEFVKELEKLKEQINKKLEEIAVIELPAFKLPEHKIVYKDKGEYKELSYYVFPYLLEVKLDKALIAYKENVVLENGEIRGYRDYETEDLGVMRYRVRSI
jgi:hypothetical protein